jgi:exosortase/archaeosortase family protein
VSPINQQDLNSQMEQSSLAGSTSAPRALFVALILSLAATLADLLLSPILFSSSPLWATSAGLLLIWRRGELTASSSASSVRSLFSASRILLFVAAHAALVLLTRAYFPEAQQAVSNHLSGSLLLIGWKFGVLLPTLVLLPWAAWRILFREYQPEFIASVVVLLTFFPRRALETLWPWYSQILGRSVYVLTWPVVSGLKYVNSFTPTLIGPQLDVTIIPACSGINGLELFDYLAGFIMVVEWTRLHKGRALQAYFLGIFAMLFSNALRISSLVIMGNHGLAQSIARFHLEAGWLFFSAAFLVYLSITYRWMLNLNRAPVTKA